MNRNLKWLKGPELKNKDGKQFQWRISAYESLFLKDGTTLFVTGGSEEKKIMYDFVDFGDSSGNAWAINTISGLVEEKSNMI